MPTAAEYAADQVAVVRDDAAARLGLLRSLYEPQLGRPELHLPYRRAALSFMGWQLRRGLLEPLDSERPCSPWWPPGTLRMRRRAIRSATDAARTRGPTRPPTATGRLA
ncbi:MAG TPA: hypothetical protein VFR22_12595 [Nocardioidaceae bacterium]|nr:hypothetical protein [Nocardioidaceae bacterium]